MDHSKHEEQNASEKRLRVQTCRLLNFVEVGIYALLGLMLSATALFALYDAGNQFVHSIAHWSEASEAIEAVDRLLFVLMLVEILHTVRISIQSHRLVTEPFLVVAIIASVRRMLVITLEGSSLTKQDNWNRTTEGIFRASLLELALLGGLVLVLVVSIILLRRSEQSGPAAEE